MHLKRKKLSVVFLLVSHEDNETICRLLLLQHETESILLAWATSADALAFLNSSGAADVPCVLPGLWLCGALIGMAVCLVTRLGN